MKCKLLLFSVFLHFVFFQSYVFGFCKKKLSESSQVRMQRNFFITVNSGNIIGVRKIIKEFPINVNMPVIDMLRELYECIEFQDIRRAKRVVSELNSFLLCATSYRGENLSRNSEEISLALVQPPPFYRIRFEREAGEIGLLFRDFYIDIWLGKTAKFLRNDQIILGETPLYMAVRNNDVEMVKLLLESGAYQSIHAFAKSDETAFTYSLLHWVNSKIIDLLMQYGAKEFIDCDILAVFGEALTPLEFVARFCPSLKRIFMKHQRISEEKAQEVELEELARVNFLTKSDAYCDSSITNGVNKISCFKSFLN